MNAYKELQNAVRFWAFMGTVAIPLCVLFDPLHGWKWDHTSSSAIYDQMIVSIYFALGVSMAFIARHPERNAGLLWFTVLSSYLHGGVMLFHALTMPDHHGHLLGDVWILLGALAIQIPMYRDRKQNPGRWQAYASPQLPLTGEEHPNPSPLNNVTGQSR